MLNSYKQIVDPGKYNSVKILNRYEADDHTWITSDKSVNIQTERKQQYGFQKTEQRTDWGSISMQDQWRKNGLLKQKQDSIIWWNAGQDLRRKWRWWILLSNL